MQAVVQHKRSRVTFSLLKSIAFIIIGVYLMGEASPSFAQSRVQIYGHRGAAGLSPENSLPGYETALRLGVDTVDMDVSLTKDDVVVVTHDAWLNPGLTRDKSGAWVAEPNIRIRDLTFEELQHYDVGRLNPNRFYAEHYPAQIPVDGTRIPSLKQVIEFITAKAGDKVRFQIEIKTDPRYPDASATPAEMAPAIVKVLEETQALHRAEVHSFDWRNLTLLRKQAPDLTLSFISEQRKDFNNIITDERAWTAGHRVEDYEYSVPKMIKALGGKVWCPHHFELTQAQVQTAHEQGLRVTPWTADKATDMQRLIDIGVDGIITNRPDILRGVMAANRIELPDPIL